MDNVQQLFSEFVTLTRETLAALEKDIEAKHEKVVAETKDKLLLDQREDELIKRAFALDQREKDIELTTEKLREKQTLLDQREKQINAERERLQNLVSNF